MLSSRWDKQHAIPETRLHQTRGALERATFGFFGFVANNGENAAESDASNE